MTRPSKRNFCPSRPDRAGPRTQKVSFTSGHNAADGAQILQRFTSFLNFQLKFMYLVIDLDCCKHW